jgi:DNA-binding beta-propeller fold protein YncE
MKTSSSAVGFDRFFETLETRAFFSASPLFSTTDFLSNLTKTPTHVASTVPSNGDVNPYGVATVPAQFPGGGKTAAGDILVSNFNNKNNLQGTGTTIVSVTPDGHQSLFFQGKKGLGLTTALGVLPQGYVLVGNVPAPDGANVDGPGSLLILDRNGHIVKTLTDSKLLDGPWDLTVDANPDHGEEPDVFISNVLNGTVTRLQLKVTANNVEVLSETRIGSGYLFRTDPAALVVGPTGLAFDDKTDKLYVASTGGNNIFVLSNAESTPARNGRGSLVYHDDTHLRGPLALAFAPNGDLLTANGDAVNADPANLDNSEIVEFTTSGKFVDQFQINPTAGGAFGLALETIGDDTIFAAVNDITNQLDIWKIKT